MAEIDQKALAARAAYENWIADVRDLEPSWNDLPQSHRDRLIAAQGAAFAALPAAGGVARWYLGSQNDGLFIIDKPPRPSNDDQVHEHREGISPDLVIPLGNMSKAVAETIIAAHNVSVASVSVSPAPAGEAWEELRRAYDKVKVWPEDRMRPGAVEELGQGFVDLIDLRNKVEAALRAASPLPVAGAGDPIEPSILTDRVSISFDADDGWSYAFRKADEPKFTPGSHPMNTHPHEAILEIAAALATPAPQGEAKPVAWQCRWSENDPWQYTDVEPKHIPFKRPLYASPPSAWRDMESKEPGDA